MTRGEFTNHLINEGCYPDDECESELHQLWHNSVNGQVCNVPQEETLTILTWAHIVYELKIDPPLNRDADYHVYQGWREFYKREMMKEKKEQ